MVDMDGIFPEDISAQQVMYAANRFRAELNDYYDACTLLNLGKHDNLAGAIQELLYIKSKLGLRPQNQDDLKQNREHRSQL